ncbi:conserved protein of unknown function (plasmid) [Cupriavidus taiwanensis]|uniref:Uncharacterized protein n=1 Tax=Cupriavidus taiwanensis TaxID=164546 RepID=A0A7Z7NNE6_9BURK|nr:hypothetical protein CBM2597_B30383 [Cupriavidus taiwanensis]SOZ11926.1 hypothetical protein CBM2595_B40378 [Cupriavidus taiwanensis]SOZ43281.1 hypothetical protein CBM2598_B30378 [Cupriavidus taiwanensis]SPC22527.1 hypothetical protein CBM2594_B30377 [Cupriavidus taiwanensis]SPD54037.1 conserved protein of unknown function [Cupriavidus taiwanensis]
MKDEGRPASVTATQTLRSSLACMVEARLANQRPTGRANNRWGYRPHQGASGPKQKTVETVDKNIEAPVMGT